MAEAAQYAGYRGDDVENKVFQARARARLYSPGQPMALELAKNPTALIVNNTLFAHGGVLPEHGAIFLLVILACFGKGSQAFVKFSTQLAHIKSQQPSL